MLQAVEVVSQELDAIRYHVRTPAFWDGINGSYVQPFGMITWYDPALKAKYRRKEGYLGLAFD